MNSIEYVRAAGANNSVQHPADFVHIWPINMPPDEWNPESSCATEAVPGAIPPFEAPYKSGAKNCGFNLAKYMLNHFFNDPHDPLVERNFSHADYGTFHAFN